MRLFQNSVDFSNRIISLLVMSGRYNFIYIEILTSSFLLYMPVFAALEGCKIALYRPLQAPVGCKVATAGGKVAAAGAVKYLTARWSYLTARWSYLTPRWRILRPNHKTRKTRKKPLNG
jgi:hypothetical protein